MQAPTVRLELVRNIEAVSPGWDASYPLLRDPSITATDVQLGSLESPQNRLAAEYGAPIRECHLIDYGRQTLPGVTDGAPGFRGRMGRRRQGNIRHVPVATYQDCSFANLGRAEMCSIDDTASQKAVLAKLAIRERLSSKSLELIRLQELRDVLHDKVLGLRGLDDFRVFKPQEVPLVRDILLAERRESLYKGVHRR